MISKMTGGCLNPAIGIAQVSYEMVMEDVLGYAMPIYIFAPAVGGLLAGVFQRYNIELQNELNGVKIENYKRNADKGPALLLRVDKFNTLTESENTFDDRAMSKNRTSLQTYRTDAYNKNERNDQQTPSMNINFDKVISDVNQDENQEALRSLNTQQNQQPKKSLFLESETGTNFDNTEGK